MRCAASSKIRLLCYARSKLFVRGRKLSGRGIERFLLVAGTEVVGLAVENRFRRGLRIDIHSANETKRMFGGRKQRGGVDRIGIRIFPALSLIFHVVGGFLGNVAAVVALDYA